LRRERPGPIGEKRDQKKHLSVKEGGKKEKYTLAKKT